MPTVRPAPKQTEIQRQVLDLLGVAANAFQAGR